MNLESLIKKKGLPLFIASLMLLFFGASFGLVIFLDILYILVSLFLTFTMPLIMKRVKIEQKDVLLENEIILSLKILFVFYFSLFFVYLSFISFEYLLNLMGFHINLFQNIHYFIVFALSYLIASFIINNIEIK